MRSRVVACVAALAVASLGACATSTTGGSTFDTGGLPSAAPSELGFDPQVLDQLAEEAAGFGSTCFLVARRGKVVLARYWNGGGADTPQEVYSVTKSVTSTLVGVAQADGDLSIDDPASSYIDDWTGTPSESVTVRQLLSGVSGRFWSMESDQDLIQAADRTAYAVGLDQQETPGTEWVYNNAAVQTLDAVLRSATGTDPASFATERLFAPLGMDHTWMTQDGSDHSTNVFFGLQSTCPDLARFGTLFAQDGMWNGQQVVPRAWVREAVGEPSQQLNAAYGLLWWLNFKGAVEPPGGGDADQLVPRAREELFAAQGLGGQVVLVDPRSDTVVVRLGGGEDAGAAGYQISDAARVITLAMVVPQAGP
jgi:CubicO group peptidase (beta-lactamase class C family)